MFSMDTELGEVLEKLSRLLKNGCRFTELTVQEVRDMAEAKPMAVSAGSNSLRRPLEPMAKTPDDKPRATFRHGDAQTM